MTTRSAPSRTPAIQVELPSPLRKLAGLPDQILTVRVDPDGAEAQSITLRQVLDALESSHPELLGTIRDQRTGERRAYMRYFACGQDISHASPDEPLPNPVAEGQDTLRVVGAIAGG